MHQEYFRQYMQQKIDPIKLLELVIRLGTVFITVTS